MYKYMKILNISAKLLLTFALAGSALTLSATDTPPPRGNAYGYFLKDGAYVLFTYSLEDGTRLITLSHCHSGTRYLLEYSVDVLTWTPLTVMKPSNGTTVSYLHTEVMPKAFYRVTQLK